MFTNLNGSDSESKKESAMNWKITMLALVVGVVVLVATVAVVNSNTSSSSAYGGRKEAVATEKDLGIGGDGLEMPLVSSQNCETVCKAKGSRAIQTDYYQNSYNHPFYMCATNYNNEGFRGGYQLGRSGAHCTIPWGGKEIGTGHFKCICEEDLVTHHVVSVEFGGGGKNCASTCGAHSMQAVQTGLYYNRAHQPFYACAANYNKEGYRGGYNLGGATHCTVPWGGREVGMTPFMCVCI